MTGWSLPTRAYAWLGLGTGGDTLASMIAMHRGAEKAYERRSHGARCLADWLMRDRARQHAFDNDDLLSATVIDRLLTGEIEPTAEMGARIAVLTRSAITPDMFDEPGGEAYDAPIDLPHELAFVPAFKLAPLGQVPPGPLVQVEPTADGFFVKLPGMVFAADHGTSSALREALGRAIDARDSVAV